MVQRWPSLGRNMNICQEQILRVDGGRTIGNPNDRHRKIEQTLENVGSLATNFLPVRRLEDVSETCSIDRIYEGISRAREKQRPVVLVESDLLKRARQILMGLASE